MPKAIQLRGVQPLRVTEEARKDELVHLEQTLPHSGIAVASLRWRPKNLGWPYECTCMAEGCSYQPDSLLGLARHLKMGHYRLRELRDVSEVSSRHSSRSSFPYYCVNPAIMKGKGMQLKYCRLCQYCGVYLSSAKAMRMHYSR